MMFSKIIQLQRHSSGARKYQRKVRASTASTDRQAHDWRSQNMKSTAVHDAKTKHAIEILLDSFVQQQRYLPSGASPICSIEELPRRLKERAQNTESFACWRAWIDEGRLRFLVASLTEQSRARAGLLCLRVDFFDADGAIVASGEWALRDDASWMLIRVHEVPLRASTRPFARLRT